MTQPADYLTSVGAKPIKPGAQNGGDADYLASVGATRSEGADGAPQATMGADTRPPVERWLSNAENDLRGGGARTIVGRTLGRIQGRGDKGYTGLEYGVSPETADTMGSVPLGITRVAEGANDYWHGHPIRGGLKALGGELQMATIPSSFVAPEAGATGTELRTMFGIPNEAHAARMLNEVGEAAQHTPVSFGETQPAMGEFQKYVDAGGRNPRVAKLLGRRIDQATAPSGAPVEFPEGRRFYTNVSRATARPGFLRRALESPAAPDLRWNLGGVKTALNSDLTEAAAKVGKGPQYTQAMKEYRQAEQINDIAKKVGTAAAGGALIKYGGPAGRTALHISRVSGQ